MEKKLNFKKFLATASAFAVITGAGNSAMGAVVVTTGNPATITAGGGNNLNAAFTDGVDTIQLGGAHDLITGSDVNLSAGVIDTNANANQTFTVGHNVNYGAGLDLDMKLTVNAGSITIQDITNAADDVTLNGGTLTMRDAGHDIIVTGGILTAARDVVHDLKVTGGIVTAVNDVGNNVSVNAGTVNQTGTIAGTLDVVNGGLYVGGAGADVTGAVTINTNNVGINTLHDAKANVTLTAGNLTMNDALSDVLVTAGAFIANDLTGAVGNGDLTVNGGTAQVNDVARHVALANAAVLTQAGTIGGTLTTANDSLFLGDANATDITGAVTINTASDQINTFHDATANVTLTAGNLTMNNALSDVLVTAGAFIANDLTGAGAGNGDLTVNGGTAQVNDVARHVALANAAVVTQTGTIGGTLTTANDSLFLGDANATDITGAVTINTASDQINTFHDAKANVTLTAGKLTMNDATGGAALVTVTAGELIMHNAAHDLTVNGGTAQVNNVANDLIVNKGTVTANEIGNDVTVDGANAAVVTVSKVGNDVTFANAGNLSVAGDIGGIVDNAGTLTLTGAGTVTGAVGGGAKVTKIIAQADRTFTNAGFAVGELAIEGASTISFTATDLADTAVTTTANDRLQNIKVNVDQTITGNIGTAANPIGNMIAENAGRTIKIQTLEFNAGVATEIANDTTVNFTLANAKALNLGSAAKQLLKVDFQQSGLVENGVYSNEVEISAGNTATLGGTIQSGNFHLANVGSTASFLDGAVVDSIIKTDNGGQGVVEFAGGATISQNLGEAGTVLNTVTFANDAEKTALLGADIYATNIAMQKGVVKLDNDVVLNGITTATATTIDLVDKDLVANGNLTFNGANKIKFSTKNAGNTLVGGQITIAAGKNLAFAAGTELAITADDKGNARPVGGASHNFTLIDGDVLAVAGNKLDISKVTVGNTNAFTRWKAAIGQNNRLVLTQTDNASGKLKEILGTRADVADNENIDALANATLDTEGYKVIELLSTLTDNTDKTEETLDRLAPLTTVADSIENTTANVGDALGARAMSLAGNQGHPVQNRVVSSERVVGVSAGDDHARFGAWFSPFYNNTTQKARKGAAGYKGESYGASFGFDTRTNEDMIIGAAFTAANSELKHKNFKSGDKTKVNSLLFSIYGMHQVTDTWFALGSATVGTNEIRNSERKVSSATNYEIASAKYSSMSFSGEVMFGYNHITEQATITPMGGFRYTRVNDGGYKESGTAFQNLDVSTKASNKFEVILGARASGGTFDLNGLSVTPEVHAFINHDLINKNPNQSIKLGSTSLVGKSRKPVRTTYNLGLGANAEFGAMEYGASYDAQLANKRVGHQGTLRLRVNF